MSDWFKLDHFAAVILRGDDAEAFAQSQFTGNLSTVGPDQWHPMAWCSPKGKTLAVMVTALRECAVDLVLPRVQLEMVANRLPMFAIGRKVEVLTTNDVAGCLKNADDAPSLAFDPERALKVGTDVAAGDNRQQHDWQMADLSCAVPWLTPETSDRYLPQMLGLEQLGALSYDKGCFPGQEVIARIHYLGKVKRRLAGIHIDAEADLSPGTGMSDENHSKIGEVLWSAGASGRTLALAVIDTAVATGNTVLFESEHGPLHGQVTVPEGLC